MISTTPVGSGGHCESNSRRPLPRVELTRVGLKTDGLGRFTGGAPSAGAEAFDPEVASEEIQPVRKGALLHG